MNKKNKIKKNWVTGIDNNNKTSEYFKKPSRIAIFKTHCITFISSIKCACDLLKFWHRKVN